jgi:ribosomal protein S18 acetylase RimI-like enzyme
MALQTDCEINAASVRLAAPARAPRIVDLRHMTAGDLEPLLLEETAEWDRELDWDFSKSADLVRKIAGGRGLSGAALVDRGEVAGYGYIGLDGHLGSIWDVYVRPRWRAGNSEALLFGVLFDALTATSSVCRVESQLMLVEGADAKALRRDRSVRLFERLLMTLDASIALPPDRGSTTPRFRFEPWSDRHLDAAAEVISLAYAGHIDSQMNDHYRTLAGASHFLSGLLEFPGSATFHRPGSYVAFDSATCGLAGISLASFIANEVAHITEVCVAPAARGVGLGYELLRRSVATLCGAGAQRISLTVTGANQEALRLYARCGFRETRRFHAYAWERN